MVEHDLELRSVSKHYPPRTPAGRGGQAESSAAAVSDLTLAVPRGHLFSLLGPSGCGKSTTLRMVAGFVPPTTGVILIRGEEVNHLPPHLRNVHTTFQSYALFPHLDVFENIAFGLRRRRLGEREIAEKVAWALALVRLEGFERRRPAALSGGEQQRVAMARALVNSPALLLLDEPLSALDQKLRQHMQHELRRIQRETGITFVMVTHDQEEALAMSDGIAVMQGGRILQVGPPHELYEHPRTRFVAEFLGATNFLPGRVAGRHGAWTTLDLDDASIRLPSALMPAGADEIGRHVEVCVRPEQLQLWEPESDIPSSCNRLPARLVDWTYQGASTRLGLVTPHGHRVVATRTSHPAMDGLGEQGPGRSLVLTWEPAATRVLPGPGVQG